MFCIITWQMHQLICFVSCFYACLCLRVPTTEHVKKTTTADENFPRRRNQLKTLPARNKPHLLTDETTGNSGNDERPTRGRMMSATSFDQLVSGVPRKRQAQHEDMASIVTYDGVEDTDARAAKATSTHSHREVNVIVHKSSSSSSSTCSSVRSVDQRKHAARYKCGTPRDHIPSVHHLQVEKKSNEHAVCISADSKVVDSKQGVNICTDETKVDYEETLELQVLETADGVRDGESSDEQKQDMTKLGGSLADMFDS